MSDPLEFKPQLCCFPGANLVGKLCNLLGSQFPDFFFFLMEICNTYFIGLICELNEIIIMYAVLRTMPGTQ